MVCGSISMFFFSSRRRHTICSRDWSSDVCSSDLPHMHPSAEGAALGYATHRDFRLFCALVEQMHAGGVYLNWGSAVLLPEVFLKAVSVVRNLGVALCPKIGRASCRERV